MDCGLHVGLNGTRNPQHPDVKAASQVVTIFCAVVGLSVFGERKVTKIIRVEGTPHARNLVFAAHDSAPRNKDRLLIGGGLDISWLPTRTNLDSACDEGAALNGCRLRAMVSRSGISHF